MWLHVRTSRFACCVNVGARSHTPAGEKSYICQMQFIVFHVIWIGILFNRRQALWVWSVKFVVDCFFLMNEP
jgi:hypothetical protein